MNARKQFVVLAMGTMFACSAVAQSNSLFRRGHMPPAAPQRPADARKGDSAGEHPQPPPEAVSGGSAATPETAGAPAGAPVPQRTAPVTPGDSAMGRQTVSPGVGQPSTNPMLQSVSPIAVSLPQPETMKVHDLITIIVREDKSATSDSKTTSDKKWNLQADLAKWIRLNPDDHLIPQTFPDGAPAVDFNWQDKWEGTGKVNRKDSLITRITAEVIDVKPNGNLVLEARKRIKVDEDEQIATLTGTCRSRDVSAQNTVLSTQVAEVQIDISHTGAARDATRRGWLKRAADFLRPF